MFRKTLYEFANESFIDLCGDQKESISSKVTDTEGYNVGDFKFHKRFDSILKQKSHFRSRILSYIWTQHINFDEGAVEIFWFDARVHMSFLALIYSCSFVSYQIGKHRNTQIYAIIQKERLL